MGLITNLVEYVLQSFLLNLVETNAFLEQFPETRL